MSKKTLEEEVSEFVEFWMERDLISIMTQMKRIVNLYEFKEGCDWVGEEVNLEDADGIRLITACYLMSKFCEFNVGAMLTANTKFKRIWEKMDKVGITQE